MMAHQRTLPPALYRAAQVRALERGLLDKRGIDEKGLMEEAGRAAFLVLHALWPRVSRIAVVCGTGNNGGDGYVLARLAEQQGLEPLVLAVGDPRPGSTAAEARAGCELAGVTVEPFSAGLLAGAEVIVDALFGIGLDREVRGAPRAAIEAMNSTQAPRLAIDIPSGLDADTGAARGCALRADATATFVALKPGLFTAEGPACCGEIHFDALGAGDGQVEMPAAFAVRSAFEMLAHAVSRRDRSAHKGDFGHVLVIGGGPGMPGAARLAGEAAARAGAGLVSIATHPGHAASLNATCPELMVHGVRAASALKPLLARATVIALGPGLGDSAWARALFSAALASRCPMVLDADGLNHLAGTRRRRDDWILTPHPGEAARLLGTSSEAVQCDRYASAQAIARRYGGVCVLKGAGTVIAAPGGEIEVCDRGNPGMASGGCGDVLTGVIAALLAQGVSLRDAARVGVWTHAMAGDAAAQAAGEIGLLASDLIPGIRRELNRLADANG